MKRAFLASLFVGVSAAAIAQTSPAQMGITPTTLPEVLQVLDNTNTWVPLGTVDPSTHHFTVVGGGGSGGGAAFATHAALLAATVTTIPESIEQQGFWASGDGGAATYDWTPTSFCAAATSGADVASGGDDLVCILPSGQSRNTAGRYLLRMNDGAINAKQLGFRDDGTDNGPLIDTLNNVLGNLAGPLNNRYLTGPTVVFASDLSSLQSNYWFNRPLYVTHDASVICDKGSKVTNYPRVNLIFGAGTGGYRVDTDAIDTAGASHNNISGCGIILNAGGWIYDPITAGSNVIPNTPMPLRPPAQFGSKQPDPLWSIGDGIAVFPQVSYWYFSGYIVNDVLTVTTFSHGWSTTDPGVAVGQIFWGMTGLPHGIKIKATKAEDPTMTGTGHEGTYRLTRDIANPPIAAEAIPSGMFGSAAAPLDFQTEVQTGEPNVPMGTTVTGCSSLVGTLCTASTGTLTLSGPVRVGITGPSFLLPGPNTTSREGDQSFNVTTSSGGKNYGPITGSISGTVLTVTGGAGSLKLGQRIIGGYGAYASTTATAALAAGDLTIPVASCAGIIPGQYVIAFNGGNQVFLPRQTVASCSGTTLTLASRLDVVSVIETVAGSNVLLAETTQYFNPWLLWKGTPVSGPGISPGTVVVSWKFAPYSGDIVLVTVSNAATATSAPHVALNFGGVGNPAPSGTTLYFEGGQSDRTIITYGTGTGGNGTYNLDHPTTELPLGSQLFAYDTPGTIYISSGPRIPMPQEILWIDGFPFGVLAAKIFPTSLTSTSNITVLTSDTGSYNDVPGFSDHPAGSGKMWIIPSGLTRGTEGNSFGNLILGFAAGISMVCAADNYSPPEGCGKSKDSDNNLIYNIVGRLVVGNNSGGSSSTFNQYDHNIVADIVEFGTVGSTYIGEMLQGEDESSNSHDLMALCGTGTTFTGIYASGSADEASCATAQGRMLGTQTEPSFNQTPAPPWFGDIYGAPFDAPLVSTVSIPAANCSGAPTGSFKVQSGVVTHC